MASRSRVLTFRLTQEEYDRFASAVASSSLTAQAYGRAKLLAESTPTALAAATYSNEVISTLSGLEGAIQKAKAALAAKEEPHG
jgi:hypothetical protein